MSFETKSITLSAPVNLVEDPDIVAANPPVDPLVSSALVWAFVQNTGAAPVYWREAPGAPQENERAHRLAPDAGIVVLLTPPAFWLWAPDPAAEVTVSPGAPMPTREWPAVS